jgi:hypothetical protein
MLFFLASFYQMVFVSITITVLFLLRAMSLLMEAFSDVLTFTATWWYFGIYYVVFEDVPIALMMIFLSRLLMFFISNYSKKLINFERRLPKKPQNAFLRVENSDALIQASESTVSYNSTGSSSPERDLTVRI